VVWALGAHPGRTQSDIDELQRAHLADTVRTVSHLESVVARIEALEARTEIVAEDAGAREAIGDVASDLLLLRDSLRLELMVVDAELVRLAEIIDEVAGGIGGPDPSGPLSEEEEPRWVVLAGDPEPGVRFSALVRLGRARTDRSVQASVARLDDDAPEVVWQALRNLGSFRERATAPRIARLLGHDAAVVRGAALEALLRMGAPADTGYDPVGSEDTRTAAAARLRSWAND
jgi:hypothetical protein